MLGAAGQECPLDPRDAGATVGGVARGRALRATAGSGYGPLRDRLLEVRFVTADGRLVKGGGPTVKNVTGYDLPRLLVGSLGTLGVLVQVTLRCQPRPAALRVVASTRRRPVRGARATVPAVVPRVGRRHRRTCCSRAIADDVAARAHARSAREPRDAAPAWPDGSAPRPDLGAARPRLRALGQRLARRRRARGWRRSGVGTVHVAADDDAGAGRGPRRRRRRPAAGCCARRARPGSTASASRCRTPVLSAGSATRSTPTGKLLPGPPPARRPMTDLTRRRGRRSRASSASTRTSSSPASRAGCACRTARRTGSPASRSASPRGRIAAMRAVELDGAPLDDAFARRDGECVQCRGCEAACPSSVPFGHLMEGRRRAGDSRRPTPQRRRSSPARRVVRLPLVLPRHRLLLALTWVLLVAQRLHLVPRRFGLPRLSAPVAARARCVAGRTAPATRTCSPAASWTRGSATSTAPRCG